MTREQAAGQTDDIPIARVVGLLYKHGKSLVIEEVEIGLGTHMFKFHQWYLQKSKEEMRIFVVKYRDQDFFRGEDDFWVDIELMHAIYRREALKVSFLCIWVL